MHGDSISAESLCETPSRKSFVTIFCIKLGIGIICLSVFFVSLNVLAEVLYANLIAAILYAESFCRNRRRHLLRKSSTEILCRNPTQNFYQNPYSQKKMVLRVYNSVL